MITVANKLRTLVREAKPRLLSLGELKVAEKPYSEKWSLKETLGHLIDSACNNHQRFVRMQLAPDIGPFSYEQEKWNKIQGYQLEPWADLVELWTLYNAHLAHLIEHVDPGSLNHTCDVGSSRPTTLRFIMEDYVRHVQHHLDQILGDADPRGRTKWVRKDLNDQSSEP
jgi:hypothetical protein